MIHPTAIIYPGVILGKNVEIGPYSVIGAPPEDLAHLPDGNVYIGNNVRIREFVTVHAPWDGSTVVGDGSYIMSHAHIGHDTMLEEDTIISTGAIVGGFVTIGKKARLGLNSVVHPKRVVGAYSIVGIGSVVVRDVMPWYCVAGNPTRFLRKNHQQTPECSLEELWESYTGKGDYEEWLSNVQ